MAGFLFIASINAELSADRMFKYAKKCKINAYVIMWLSSSYYL